MRHKKTKLYPNIITQETLTPQPQHDNNTQQPERFFSRELDFNIQ